VPLARRAHVWVVESPVNTPAARAFWDLADAADADPLGSGITAFVANEGESQKMVCQAVLVDIDDHHGDFTHIPPWTEIRVYGVCLDGELREACRFIGAESIEETEDGFICRR